MSANNRAVCPKCAAKRDAEIRAERAEIDAAYGKVPVGEYLDRLNKHELRRAKEPFATLREDYETYGAETGIVIYVYSASYKVCGLSADGRYELPLWTGDAE